MGEVARYKTLRVRTDRCGVESRHTHTLRHRERKEREREREREAGKKDRWECRRQGA